jgi:hypothetical protein
MKRLLGRATASLVATIGGLAAPVLSESMGPTAKLDGDRFVERLAEQVPVSGLVVRGVQLEHGPTGHWPTISVFVVSSQADDPICVRLVSRDGTYSADNTYLLPAMTTPGFVGLDLSESQYLSRLDRPSEDEFAVLARWGRCSDRDPGPALLSTRSATPALTGAALRVLVNAEQATTALLVEGLGEMQAAQCWPIDEGRRTSFDTTCVAQNVASLAEIRSLHISRRKFDQLLSPTRIAVSSAR